MKKLSLLILTIFIVFSCAQKQEKAIISDELTEEEIQDSTNIKNYLTAL